MSISSKLYLNSMLVVNLMHCGTSKVFMPLQRLLLEALLLVFQPLTEVRAVKIHNLVAVFTTRTS